MQVPKNYKRVFVEVKKCDQDPIQQIYQPSRFLAQMKDEIIYGTVDIIQLTDLTTVITKRHNEETSVIYQFHRTDNMNGLFEWFNELYITKVQLYQEKYHEKMLNDA